MISTAMLDSLKKGDLIEIKRKLGYSHWVVYIGGGMVIHLTSPRENSSGCILGCEEKGVVKEGKLTDEIDDSTWRINNSKDKLFKVLPVDEILKNAQSMRLGTKPHPDYNLLNYNCEHFASHCRYGVIYSEQAEIAQVTKKVLLPKISELLEYIHEKHGRLTSETIEVVQKMAAQIPCFHGVQASMSCASPVLNRLYLVGLGLKILGCALKQTDTLQELGEKMDDYGNTLDPTLKVLKGIADLANIFEHICNGDYGHALFSLAAAVWPYIPAAIREKVEAAPKAAVNMMWSAAETLTERINSWLFSVKCIFF